MKRHAMVGLALMLGTWAGLAGCGADAQQDATLDLFPVSILNEFALLPDEVPPTYQSITDANLLEQAGLARNPDYLTRRAALEDMIQMHGIASFLALYGPDESVRLVVKGVYFRELQHALKYAEVQSTRERQVRAFRRDTPSGIWLLFIACDPELRYDEQERRAISRGLEHYQRRLGLAPLFDQIASGQTD